MPKLSPTMEEGQISSWVKEEGDAIEANETIAEVDTDSGKQEDFVAMKHFIKLVSFTLLLVTATLSGLAQKPTESVLPDLATKNAGEKLPKDLLEFLKNAEEFEVLMQATIENGKWVYSMPKFFKPNYQVSVSKSKLRSKIVKSLFKTATQGQGPSACFLPSHGLRARNGNKSVEIEICFGCRNFFIKGSFGKFIGTVPYKESKLKLNKILDRTISNSVNKNKKNG